MKRFPFFVCLILILLILVVPVTAAITKISPMVGYTGKTTTVMINGSNFTSAGMDVILTNDYENIIGSIGDRSNTSIECTFAISKSREPGDWDLIVINNDGYQQRKSHGFTIRKSMSSTSITPLYAQVNNDSVNFTLVGTGLSNVVDVFLRNNNYDNITAVDFVVISSTNVEGTFDLTDTDADTYDVCVVDDLGTEVCTLSFDILLTSTPPPFYGHFNVPSISVDPSASLTTGTPVIVTFNVGILGSGDETFPSGNELQMFTDLESAIWTYSLVLDGIEMAQPSTSGRVLLVSGWVLSYPSTVQESLNVTLEGTAPSVASSMSRTIVNVTEFDSGNNLVGQFSRTDIITNVPASKIGVFRKSTQSFYMDTSGDGKWGVGDSQYAFGLNGDIPVAGDWNNDGKTEIGVFRQSKHMFYLDYNRNGAWNGAFIDRSTNFGLTGDLPVAGDWNKDGITEIGVFRPSMKRFYLDTNGNGLWGMGDSVSAFGLSGDLPIAGDWNKDGITEIGVFRPSTQRFYLDTNGNGLWGVGDSVSAFGLSGDLPIAGDWNKDGITEIGVFRPSTQRFYLDTNGNGLWGAGDTLFSFGLNEDWAVAGMWG